MKPHIRCAILCAYLLIATTASAAEFTKPVRSNPIIHGGGTILHKAAGDTIDLMGPTGSGAAHLGDFEAGWNGWTSIDRTQATEVRWQVSDYNQPVTGNLAAWCGSLSFISCDGGVSDPDGGYGNSWDEMIAYRTTVADPGASASVNVVATLQHDTEGGYDWVRLSAKIQGSLDFVDIRSWDGTGTVAVNENFTYQASELVDGTDVFILFRFQSDGAFSDEDCFYRSAGACQIDDITVTTTQSGQAQLSSFTNFTDGTFGDWFVDFPVGVGDFAGLWSGLGDRDPCGVNLSQQVAFIDDGLVVPGTGGTQCINWCYGPGGYIVNTTGGLAGPASFIEIDVLSPVMTWPNADYDGITFDFDVYRHEELTLTSPGIVFDWDVRSADTDNSAGNGFQNIADQPLSRRFLFVGGPEYTRFNNDISDLMNPGRDEVQVVLRMLQLSWVWSSGNDGTPAPYFDNVVVKVFPIVGPVMTTREVELAQDNFPEVDIIDFADLGSMHVRFDMARSISTANPLTIDPGDSIVVEIQSKRAGAVLTGTPELHYVIDANPVFDTYRTTATSGVVPAVSSNFSRWAFDLPDTGTLFPGDVLHYYIRAGDDAGGDIQYATLPADRSGYGDFSKFLTYNSSFVVHALPTINSDGVGGYEVPKILFWNDFGNGGGEEEWYFAFHENTPSPGVDYDIYYTNSASLGLANGIGGRTNGAALEKYTELFYTAGNLKANTIGNGDLAEGSSDDIGALLTWLSGGNKDLFLTGDNLVSDLMDSGTAGIDFVQTVMGLDLIDDDIRPIIVNQATPLVVATPGNPVFLTATQWIAYGGCKSINTFDAVTARPGATRLAEFTDPSGLSGSYTYAAATLNFHSPNNRIISMPYDFMSIYTASGAKIAAPAPARVQALGDVVAYFAAGPGYPIDVSDVPLLEKFAVQNFPNPFNPSTKISYTVDKPGAVFTLKIYTVRGQLVRTLYDGRVQTSGFVMWDGTDDAGASVASGVYFREARLGDQVQVGKMALLK